MDYAEASYFDGFHFAHVAAYCEHKRLARIAAANRRALEADRRRNGRAVYRLAA